MQMQDLQLDMASNSATDGKLKDEIAELIECDDSVETGLGVIQGNDPLDHVDALSKRIQDLTQSLQQGGSSNGFHETTERMIELEAHLAKMQNEINKQNSRGDKIETSLQLIKALGDKIDSLSQEVDRLATESVQNDYSDNFNALTQSIKKQSDELKSVNQLLQDQPDLTVEIQKQADAITGLGEILDEMKSRSLGKEQLQEFEKKLDSIGELANSSEALDGIGQKLDALNHDIRHTEEWEALARQVDAIASQVGTSDRLDVLEQKLDAIGNNLQKVDQFELLAEKIDAVGKSTDHSERFVALESRLDSLAEIVQFDDRLEQIENKIGSLNDFVKLGALENEQFDVSKINEMSDQISAIGKMLIERGNCPDDTPSQDTQQLSLLNTNVESLVQLLNNRDTSTSGPENTEQLNESVAQLIEKFDALRQSVDSGHSSSVGGSENIGRFETLTEKLESLSALLESRDGSSLSIEGNASDVSEQIKSLSKKFDRTQETVKQLAESFAPAVTDTNNEPRHQEPDKAEDTSEKPLSGWEKQKKELLEGYGVETPKKVAPKIVDEVITDEEEPPKTNDDDSLEKDNAERELSTPEIDELRTQLEDKLRQAEVDISIERAKMHQERRDLDEKHSDLDRKQTKLDTHSPNSDTDPPGEKDDKSGGRWSRFLGK